MYLAITRLRNRMTTDGDIQNICQAIVRLLFLALHIGAFFDTIEPTLVVPRIQFGIVNFATFFANTVGAETNKFKFDASY